MDTQILAAAGYFVDKPHAMYVSYESLTVAKRQAARHAGNVVNLQGRTYVVVGSTAISY